MGILLGKRHVLPDLMIALASTTSASRLSVAYLDANGFKAINDTISHAAGDEAAPRPSVIAVAGKDLEVQPLK